MKKNVFSFFLLAILAVTTLQSCKKNDSDPQADARTNLSKTWRLDLSSCAIPAVAGATCGTTLNGIALNTLLSGFPAAARPDFSTVRLSLLSAGAFTVTGGSLTGIPPAGTWTFDGSSVSKIILSPGSIGVDISNLTANTLTVSYSFNSTGTPYAALGATVVVKGNLIP